MQASGPEPTRHPGKDVSDRGELKSDCYAAALKQQLAYVRPACGPSDGFDVADAFQALSCLVKFCPASEHRHADQTLGQELWAKREAFDALLDQIRAITENLYGAGKLLAYDTALRLGAHFGHRPTKVYLHAGPKAGAFNLGYALHNDFLELDELPPEFQNLLPEQVEDILCIYKEDLKAFWAVRARRHS